MKQNIVISVGKDRIRKLVDPFGRIDTTFALVRIGDLPQTIPLENNPRAQNIGSRVARQISETLENSPEQFHYLNRGITIVVPKASYDNKSQKLTLEFSNERSGALDGGHTYAVICDMLRALTESREEMQESYVRLEIMEGKTNLDLLTNIAKARNTSAQVKEESLANVQGRFDWIRDSVSKEKFAEMIAYRENEDRDELPIGIREIVAFAFMNHPAFIESENAPIDGYVSKGRCLEHFLNEANERGYHQLKGILPDVLKLSDYLQKQIEEKYRELGGFSGLTGDKGAKDAVKLGKVREVKHYKDGYQLVYLGEKAEFRFPDAWIYPIVASLRALLSFGKNGTANGYWRVDPFKYFDKYGKALVRQTLDTSVSLGRTVNAVGKSKAHWTQLHEKVQTQIIKLSGGKDDAIIEL